MASKNSAQASELRKMPKRIGRHPTSVHARESRGEPKIIAYLAVSLDGYIAMPDGGCAWLDPYGDSLVGFPPFMKSLGAIVMGRGTFDFMVKNPPPPEIWPGCDLPNYVLTHRPLPRKPISARITPYAGSVRKLAARLRREVRGDIWLMGGGVAIKEFLNADLIDRWRIFVIPVILGDGIPLVAKTRCKVRPLRLTHTRTYRSGVVELVYHRDDRPGRKYPRLYR